MTSPKTPEWAEHWGREAVRLGMPWESAMPQIKTLRTEDGWSYAPDFRDPLTEIAVIPWVQAVAREVYGLADVKLTLDCSGEVFASVEPVPQSLRDGRMPARFKAPTLAEAACRLVAAMRGDA